MSEHELLPLYLDRRLTDDERADFERHLESCGRCRDEVRAWQTIVGDLGAWASERVPVGDPLEAERALVRAARERYARPTRRRWWLGLASATAATLVVVAVWMSRREAGVELRRGTAQTPEVTSAATAALEPEEWLLEGDAAPLDLRQLGTTQGLSIPRGKNLVLRAGGDRIGVAGGSVIRSTTANGERRLVLERGAVACAVESRRAGESFSVTAGEAIVRVVGTRFLVVAPATPTAELTVAVTEGTVEVELPKGTTRVNAQHQLRIVAGGLAEAPVELGSNDAARLEALLTPGGERTPPEASAAQEGAHAEAPRDSEATSPSGSTAKLGATGSNAATKTVAKPAPKRELDAWRKLVLSGEHAAAARALEDYLAARPRDVDAWLLLADAHRKAERFAEAVEAHRRVIKLGDPATANQARFRAASVLQDQLRTPREVVPLLETYLKQGAALRPLEAAAMVRLARAYRDTYRVDDATELLRRVVSLHPDTPAAREAATLLGSAK